MLLVWLAHAPRLVEACLERCVGVCTRLLLLTAAQMLGWPLRRSNSNSSAAERPSLTPAEKLKGYYDLAKVCRESASPAASKVALVDTEQQQGLHSSAVLSTQ